MSLGRPVEPPEVGAFHAGEVASGSGASEKSGPERCPIARWRIVPGSVVIAESGAPTTTFEAASPTIAASSRAGSRADTGWGIAPMFQHATYAMNHSIEFGIATVTNSPCPTPDAWSSRPIRRASDCSSDLVIVVVPHVTAGASGRSSAREFSRAGNEIRLIARV
jgi:hypothetical protein